MNTREIKIKKILMAILIVLLLITGVFVIKGYFEGHFRSMDSMRAYMNTFGMFAPLVLVLIQALQVVLPVLPGMIGCAVGAGMFGAATGFWCNYIGISAGSIIAFLLAKWLGHKIVDVMFPADKYASCVEWINKKKCFTLLLFLSILLPLAPDDFLCYFSGVAGMSTRKFVWIILLAKPWCILFYSIVFGYFL